MAGSGRRGEGGDGGAARRTRPGQRGERQRGGRSGDGRRRDASSASRTQRGRRGTSERPGLGRTLPDADPRELPPEVWDELRALPASLAEDIAGRLAAAGRLLEDDPEAAYGHALEARRRAARVGVVREACGIAAYRAGRWSDALAELRAARRIVGGDAYLPLIADCERGLGRPERAVATAREAGAGALDPATRVELRIVESGARRDLGQYAAAAVALQVPELRLRPLRPWSARLFYAYADALLDAGRDAEAREWFSRASTADRGGETDADERLSQLDGFAVTDIEEPGDPEAGDEAEG